MARTIEAKAIISAADKTGAVFDKLAQKIKGVEKTAKSLSNINAPKFTGNMMEELKRLKLTEKELQNVRGALQSYDAALRAQRPKFEHYARAHQEFANKTVAHWRNVKANIDEASLAHKKYDGISKRMLAGAGAMAMRGAAFAGGAYGAYRVGKAAVTSASVAQRESTRDWYSGIKPEDTARFELAAKQTSGRFQSIDTNTLHEALRDTAHSTGSADKAVELSDTIGGMMTVLQSLKGKDKAVEETRKFFKALDNLGRNVDPAQIKSLSDGYLKALGVEGADMSLGDVFTMAKRLKAAGATVSDRFLYTTGAGMAMDMGPDRAGNSIAMLMQQEVQATKQAKAYGQKYGLRGSDGKFTDRSLLMTDPDQWIWKNLPGAMKRAGLDYNKPEDVNTFLGSAFSNSSARDAASKLATQQDQYQRKQEQYGRAKGMEGADELQKRDAFVAFEAAQAQLRNLAAQKEAAEAAAKGLNTLTTAIVQLGAAMEKGGWIQKAGQFLKDKYESEKRDYDKILKPALTAVGEFDQATSSPGRLYDYITGKDRFPAAEDPMTADHVKRDYPWADPMAEHGKGAFRSNEYWAARTKAEASATGFGAPGVTQSMTWGTGLQNQSTVEKSANVNVEGEVSGEMEGTFKFVVDSSGLVTAVDEMKRLSADISGKLRTIGGNGPGSTGRTSPDAQAPGGTGFGGGGL